LHFDAVKRGEAGIEFLTLNPRCAFHIRRRGLHIRTHLGAGSRNDPVATLSGINPAHGRTHGIGAAELACGATSDITAYFAGGARPKALPPQPFAKIGANAVMRWKEWRARDE
jgi:hypothetical protein